MAANNNKNKQEERQNPGKVPGGAGGNVPRPKFNPYWFYGIIAVLFLVVNYFFTGNKGPVETNWNKVRTTMLADRDVERIVVVNNEKALLYLKKNSEAKYKEDLEGTFVKPAEGGPHFFWTIGSVETFEQKLMEAQEVFLRAIVLRRNTGMKETG